MSREVAIAMAKGALAQWMKGLPLANIIRNRLAYLDKRKRPYKLPVVIRETMRDAEEVARFKAPKCLAAYVDVLNLYLEEIGKQELFPEDLCFNLFLEFGVSTTTLLSLIAIGPSRTSAIAVNEFLESDLLSEKEVREQLSLRDWETMDLPALLKRDISRVLQLRTVQHGSTLGKPLASRLEI